MCDYTHHDRGGCSSCGNSTEMETRTFHFRVKRASLIRLGIFTVFAILSCTSVALCADSSQNKLISQSTEVKSIEPTHNPTKVFVRRRIFRKLVKDTSNSSNEEPQTTAKPVTSSSTRPRTLYSIVKRVDQPSSTVTGSLLKSSMSNSQSLASRQKFNFQSLKTRLGLAASGISESTTTPQPPQSTTQNSSLVMIPLPPNQRKAYTPVIMQVSKSTTAKPETTVQTFKLNKMFVPIGIYGKVVENGTNVEESEKSAESNPSSQPSTSVRHKGTDSGENVSARKVKGIADSVDITYGRPNLARVSLTTERPDISSISLTTEANELFSGIFGGNDVRREDYNRRKNTYASNSGMTLMTPPKLGTQSQESPSTLADTLGSYSSYASYSNPHKKFTPSSIVDSITDSMSRIPSLVPSLFHKGLTSLASMTSSLKENPFVDDGFEAHVPHKTNKPLVSAPSSYTPKIPASVPGGYISGMGSNSRDQAYAGSEIKSDGASGGIDISEYETLEYFRKRPHLLAQLKKQARESSWRRSQGVRYSKGFKPVSAPEYLAREYYKSTSTTAASTPEEILNSIRQGKKMRGSWLLRNSNEYVSSKNDRVIRMWRSMLDSFTRDDPDFDSIINSKTRRIDDNVEENEDPSSSSISSRSSNKPASVLTSQWSSIKRKYSKDQINEAKERILTLLDSGYGDEALHEIADDEELQHHVGYDTASHMPPPPPPPRIKALSLTKGLSGAAAGAFNDLVKFFKLGVSVGAGHSREPVRYEEVADEQEGEEIGGSEWKPVRRPLISFSAGISLKNPSPKKQAPVQYHAHHEYEEEPQSHYSSSSKPYIPTGYTKNLNSYIDELAGGHSLKPTPYSYAEEEEAGAPPQSIDYIDDEESLGYGSPVSSSQVAPTQYRDSDSEYSFDRYTTLKPGRTQGAGGKGGKAQVSDVMQHGAASDWNPVVSGGENEYELVPSSVYLSGNHDPRDIAAVVKPAGISDELVRNALPSGLRGLRILDYPNGYNSLNSISQVLGKNGGVSISGGGGGGKGDGGMSFKNAMKKLRENYVAKESAYLPVGISAGFAGTGQNVHESNVRGVVGGYGGRYVQGVYTTGGMVSGGLSGLGGISAAGLGAGYYNPMAYQSSGLVGALSGIENGNVFATADRINNIGRGTGLGGVYSQVQREEGGQQKDALGFSTNYNLPSNLDPDIAALLKSELDKDDIPEDVRQEFLEAKEQEKKEQVQKAQQQQQQAYQQAQQQQQQAYQQAQRRADQAVEQAQRRADQAVEQAQQTLIDSLISSAKKSVVTPQSSSQYVQQGGVPVQRYDSSQSVQYQVPYPTHPTPRYHQMAAQSRQFSMNSVPAPPRPPSILTTRFFAPIPITPTLMTTAMKNPRYSSPVPRYVIELASKLQKDKTVQGIVRVSAKRGRGLPPIEYLYPVKG